MCARRGFVCHVAEARAGFWEVRLRNVRVELASGATARFEEIRAPLGMSLRPRSLDVVSGEIDLLGDLHPLREKFGAHAGAAPQAGDSIPWSARNLRLSWKQDGGDLFCEGISVSKVPHGVVAQAKGFRMARGPFVARGEEGEATVLRGDEGWVLAGAKARKVLLAKEPREMGLEAAPNGVARPLRTRSALQAAAGWIRAHLLSTAEVEVALLSFEVNDPVRGSDAPLGPGSFRLGRRGDQVWTRFSAEEGGTRLGAEVVLDDAEISLRAEGGPVTLATLGLRPHDFGVENPEEAKVFGKAELHLRSEGAVSGEVEGGLSDLSLAHPMLSDKTVSQLALSGRVVAALSPEGELRVDNLSLRHGEASLQAYGTVKPREAGAFLRLHVDVPNVSCHSAVTALPEALRPNVAGAKLSGSFSLTADVQGAVGPLQKGDQESVVYNVTDTCRFEEVPTKLSRERFKKPFSHTIYLPDGSQTEETMGPGTPSWVKLSEVSPYVTVALLTTEDGGFFRHGGFSHGAIKSAILENLHAKRFLRGASTLTMQLAKNLFLFRKKTLSRKLEEILLTDYLEQTFSKEELLELYLNVVEFGPHVYGILQGTRHYFGRHPAELTLSESLFLSSVLPAPLKHEREKRAGELSPGGYAFLHRIMGIAKKVGTISEAELERGKSERVLFRNTGPRPPIRRDLLGDEGVTVVEDDAAPAVDPEP